MDLSKTHKRILGSLLFVLEQKVENIEHILHQNPENASYVIGQDLREDERQKLENNCSLLKEKINDVARDFNLKKRTINQYQYIQTIQSQMWEHISDAFSDKLKGYGDKLRDDAKKVDPSIRELQISSISLEYEKGTLYLGCLFTLLQILQTGSINLSRIYISTRVASAILMPGQNCC